MSPSRRRPGRGGGLVRAAALHSAFALVLVFVLVLGSAQARADVVGYCDPQDRTSPAQKDRILRFAAIVKETLERSGGRVALVARSGLDLSRFGQRYSHAGFSLRASPETPWAVRQLYYDCEARAPRLFDQGMAAFLLGAERPELGYVWLIVLPPEAEAAVEAAARDDARALQLLHPRYSANAFAWGLAFQNCNQWVAELLGAAWSGRVPAGAESGAARAASLAWLREAGYEPTVFEVGSRALMWAGRFVPWLHDRGHPEEDLAARRYRVHMPASIESFVRARVPGARRFELCHDGRQVVVREGWEYIAEGCVAGPGDRVLALD